MASGDTLLTLHAMGASVTLTTDATFDTRNEQICLDFDAAADETARFTAILPKSYGGGGINVIVHAAMTTAVTGDVVVTAEIERQAGLDLDTDSFAAAQTATVTVPATAGQEFTITIGFTNGAQMDSLAVGEQFRLRVTRDANAAGDTAAGDMELYTVEIREQ